MFFCSSKNRLHGVHFQGCLKKRALEESQMELNVFDRSQKSSALRADGMLPAVVYDKKSNRSIYLERKAFDKVFRAVSTHGVITLKFENGDSLETLVKAVAMDKRKRIPEHADFVIVSDEPVEVVVPIHTKGVARGVKEQGGVLDIVLHTLTIKCSPKNIPQELVVDISDVGLGQPVHASDIVLPEGVKLVSDSKATVLTIHQPRGAENVAAVVAGTEPEVITKGKKEVE
jgi:large subunit ribosomal protein L25